MLSIMSDMADRLNAALEGRYAIERELGEGGMATVYLADDLKHERKVALKVLKPDLAAVVGAERFLAEIKTTANLRHPHILPLFDSGEADGFLFYVMPYVEGESLRDRLDRQSPLPVEDALQIGAALARGLDHAHRKGVIHRDIKPANILVQDGEPMIADFGIALAVGTLHDDRLTSTGLSPGTPNYMSPEQVAGEHELGSTTDVYSLGCVLYELLTGAPPHTGRGSKVVLAARLTERPTNVSIVRAGVPSEVGAVLEKALEPDPADRYESARTFGEALQACLAASGPRHRPSRAVQIAASLAVVAVVAGLLLMIRTGGSAVTGQQIATLDRLLEEGDYMTAYNFAADLRETAPDDALLNGLWLEATTPVDLRTEPPGAAVRVRGYQDSTWRAVGTTPLIGFPFPRGYSVLEFDLPGYRRVVTASGPSAPIETMRLFPRDSLSEDLVWVPSFESSEGLELGPFLIDKYEVTNRQFRDFVEAGGYEDRRYWEHPFVLDGVELTWDEAMERFVDRTGRPGPSTWEVSDYAAGRDEYPVGGVSWYEAAAFAAFRGRDLPTVHHWRQAAPAGDSPWIVPASNLDREMLLPTGVERGLARYGSYDMAGNVREWTFNAGPDGRHFRGGSWDDAAFRYVNDLTRSGFNRDASNGFRLATYLDRTDVEVAQTEARLLQRDYTGVEPVTDAIFASYLRLYDYDKRDLEVGEVATDTTDLWIREQVSFDSGYGADRVVAYIYKPLEGDEPLQPIIYFPGGSASGLRSIDDYVRQDPRCSGTCYRISVLVRSGRAVVFPAYAGLFERSDVLVVPPGGDERRLTLAYRDLDIAKHKDIRRTIDYLETRADMDADRVGYYGYSWGGWRSSVSLAVEPRIKTGIVEIGGLARFPLRPEIDPINFVTRVTQPVLMLNGRYDPLYPVEGIAGLMYDMLPLEPNVTKRIVIEDGGHFVPRVVAAAETLAWLDEHLGPVR